MRSTKKLCYIAFSLLWITLVSVSGAAAARPEAKQAAPAANVSVKDAGAIGDGVSDDTKAVANALAKAAPLGATVFFPAGTYRITRTIALPSGVRLNGSGNGSRLVMGRSLATGIFHAEGQSNITVSNLSFAGTGTEVARTETERLLYFDRCSHVSIANCSLSNTVIAVQGQTCKEISVTSCAFSDIKHREDLSQGYGVLLNLSCNNADVSGNTFTRMGRHAVYMSSGTSNSRITGNVIDGSESSAISLYSKNSQAVTENILIEGNQIRNVSGRVSPRGVSIAVWCRHIVVRKNVFDAVEQYAVAVEGGAEEDEQHNPADIVIEDNDIRKCRNAGIWVVNASNVTVRNNSIDAESGVVAATAGKSRGSKLRSFAAHNNRISFKKYGVLAPGNSGRDVDLKDNHFRSDVSRKKFEIHMEQK